MDVRRATADDSTWLLAQAREFEKFAGYRRSLVGTDEKAMAFLDALVREHVVLVAHTDEVRAGFIAGYLAPHPFNPEITVLSEVLWWVPEQHRHSRAAAALLSRFETLGRAQADWIILTLEHDSPIRAAHMTKRGFREVERAFLLEV